MDSEQIMEQFKQLTDFLGSILEPNYEIALLDLRDENRCITAIANGHVSGRTIGAPITDLALRIIREEIWKTNYFYTNYSGITIGNEPLVSSTFFIKNEGTLLGMLCINIDKGHEHDIAGAYDKLEKQMKKLGSLIAKTSSKNPSENHENGLHTPCRKTELPTEQFVSNLEDAISRVIIELLSPDVVSSGRFTQHEKLMIIEKLNENGYFLMKGAVTECARKLSCSEASIYRYISKIK